MAKIWATKILSKDKEKDRVRKLRSCDFYGNRCKVVNCNKSRSGTFKGCGLYWFLKRLDMQRQKFPSKEDRNLIDSLEGSLSNCWFKYQRSQGKGPATGNAFADWIRRFLRDRGRRVEMGKVDLFKFGKFAVDAVIPSREDPKTILEMKIYVDKQHALMIKGLIDQLKNPEVKVGLVTLYEPGVNLINDTVKLTDDAVPEFSINGNMFMEANLIIST